MTDFSIAEKEYLKYLERQSKIRAGYISITSQNNRYALERFKKSLPIPTPPIEGLSEDHIVHYLLNLEECGWSLFSRETEFSRLSSFFKFVETNYGVPNITRKIDGPKTQREESPCPTKKEVSAFLRLLANDEKAKKRRRVMFELMARTGPRRAEVRNLNLDDVKITPNTIEITYTGKGNKQRIIVISTDDDNSDNQSRIAVKIDPEEVAEILQFKNSLEDYLRNHRRSWRVKPASEKAFFLSNKGNRISCREIDSEFKRYMDILGLPRYTPHSLRHFFITNLLQRGVGVATVSKLVGHANPGVTYETYAHSSKEKMRSTMPLAFLPPQSKTDKHLPFGSEEKNDQINRHSDLPPLHIPKEKLLRLKINGGSFIAEESLTKFLDESRSN